MATFKLDTYIANAQIDPYVLDCGEKGQFVVQAPDGETLAQITETPINQTRRICQLLFGDQFENIWSIISLLPGTITGDIANDIVAHFKIGQVQQVPGGRGALPR